MSRILEYSTCCYAELEALQLLNRSGALDRQRYHSLRGMLNSDNWRSHIAVINYLRGHYNWRSVHEESCSCGGYRETYTLETQ